MSRGGSQRRSLRVRSSRVVYENPWMRVREDAIEHADGSPGVYGVVERVDFATVIPLERGRLWVVEQYRHAIGARSLEFPQGTCASADPPAAVARAELAQETGLRSGSLRFLGRLYGAAGFSNQGQNVFLATDLTPGPRRLEVGEVDMRVVDVSVREFEAMVRRGAICDGATLAAYALFRLDEAW